MLTANSFKEVGKGSSALETKCGGAELCANANYKRGERKSFLILKPPPPAERWGGVVF